MTRNLICGCNQQSQTRPAKLGENLEGALASTDPFTGAVMHDDHISAVEQIFSAMQDEIEDLATMVHKLDQHLVKLEDCLSRIKDRDGGDNHDSCDYQEIR